MFDFKKYKILFLISLPLFISGCTTVSPNPPLPVSTNNTIYLKDVCARNGVYWQWDPVSQVATLEHKGAKAEVLVGSSLVVVNKSQVTLSKPVRMIQSAVVVPSDFKTKVINRLRNQTQTTSQTNHRLTKVREVIIDAGHGGKDPGAIGLSNVQEKGIVLDISKRLKKILQKRGIKVRMTRDKDEFISLEKRTEIASRSKADLFVSIHANSSPQRNVYGFEVYTAKPMDFKEKNEAQRKTNHRLMFQTLKIKQGSSDVEGIITDMLYTYKQAEANSLAKKLSHKTSKFVKTKNRGNKTSRFFVVRNTLMPAILVEVGFLTNPKESKLLQKGSYREQVARGIANSILDYANGK